MKKKGSKREAHEAHDEKCLLIAESGAPWADYASWLSTRTQDVQTLIQLPNEAFPAFQSRMQEKLQQMGDVRTAVFVAASSSQRLLRRSSLLRSLVGALPGVSRIVLCPGSDPRAPAARELAGLSLTLRELVGGSSITFSLEGLRGEPLQGLAYLAAA